MVTKNIKRCLRRKIYSVCSIGSFCRHNHNTQWYYKNTNKKQQRLWLVLPSKLKAYTALLPLFLQKIFVSKHRISLRLPSPHVFSSKRLQLGSIFRNTKAGRLFLFSFFFLFTPSASLAPEQPRIGAHLLSHSNRRLIWQTRLLKL